MRWALAACAAALLAVSAAAAAAPARVSLAGPSWTTLFLQARKGPFKATAELRAERLPDGAAAAELREVPGGGGRKPDGEVIAFTTRTAATFRGSAERHTLFDRNGLLQDEAVDGKRRTLRRFLPGAVFQRREGKGRGPSERLTPFGDGAPDRGPIVDAASLLWLATALRLDREGSSAELSAVARGRIVPLRLVAKDLVEGAAAPDGGKRAARRVVVSAEDPEEDVSLFGLQGDIDLYLDAQDGMPLELRGAVQGFGHVRVRVVQRTGARSR